MRKHRLYGVVIAVLLGSGALTQRPGASHHATGVDHGHTGITLTSAKVHADAITTSNAPTVRLRGFVLRGDAQPDDAVVGLRKHILPPPPPPPPPPPAPVAQVVTAPAGSGGAWAGLRNCESHGNYADDTGNGYYGAYQFSASTWHSLGYPGLPSDAPPALQDQAAQQLQARSGWGQWPACARSLGLA
ncbi:MAG TPA: transglycosylase family protein [Acidimicrobiales bacterium]|nr:transglycosylase family protein [Acidimicrobiales bacterium]